MMQAELMNGLAEKLPTQPPESVLSLRNGLLFAFGYAPLLWLFFANLWGRPHYQFFPLVLGGAGLLAWTRLKDTPRPFERGTATLAVIFFLLSFSCLVAGTVVWSPWLGSLAVMMGLVGVIWLAGSKRLLRTMAPALILALTIIPPPLALDSRFAEQLRVLAVNWSSHVLDLLGVI